jgi:hypothetical protein
MKTLVLVLLSAFVLLSGLFRNGEMKIRNVNVLSPESVQDNAGMLKPSFAVPDQVMSLEISSIPVSRLTTNDLTPEIEEWMTDPKGWYGNISEMSDRDDAIEEWMTNPAMFMKKINKIKP